VAEVLPTLDAALKEAFVDGNRQTPVIKIQDMDTYQRLHLTLSLYPYIIPLFLVYAAEYTMQAGTWTAIGFPITNAIARNDLLCGQLGLLCWSVHLQKLWHIIYRPDVVIVAHAHLAVCQCWLLLDRGCQSSVLQLVVTDWVFLHWIVGRGCVCSWIHSNLQGLAQGARGICSFSDQCGRMLWNLHRRRLWSIPSIMPVCDKRTTWGCRVVSIPPIASNIK
jgi:hypothetical protein